MPPKVFATPSQSGLGWEIYPEGLCDLLGRLHFYYPLPALHITENGAAYPHEIDRDRPVDDPLPIAYLKPRLGAAARAIAAGAALRGHFVRSLVDNFQWAHGYSIRKS